MEGSVRLASPLLNRVGTLGSTVSQIQTASKLTGSYTSPTPMKDIRLHKSQTSSWTYIAILNPLGDFVIGDVLVSDCLQQRTGLILLLLDRAGTLLRVVLVSLPELKECLAGVELFGNLFQ